MPGLNFASKQVVLQVVHGSKQKGLVAKNLLKLLLLALIGAMLENCRVSRQNL